MAVISILAGLLVGYLVNLMCFIPDRAVVFGAVSWLTVSLSLIGVLSLRHTDSRLSVNLRILSNVFLIIFLTVSFGSAWLNLPVDLFVVAEAMLTLIYLGAYYKLSKAELS